MERKYNQQFLHGSIQKHDQKVPESGSRKSTLTRRTLLLCVAAVLLALLGCFLRFIYRVSYTHNDHFLVRKLLVPKTTHFNSDNVTYLLANLKGDDRCVLDETNLLTVNLRSIKQAIMKYPCVESVEIRRILPGTLRLDIMERTPLAYLYGSRSKNGIALIDQHAIPFPYSSPSDVANEIPYITNVPPIQSLKMGTPCDHAAIRSAVNLINLIYARPQIDGAGYTPQTVKLNVQNDRLDCIMKPLADNILFPQQGATISFPLAEKKHEPALDRIDAIFTMKIQNGEKVSMIDATYENNIPTRE